MESSLASQEYIPRVSAVACHQLVQATLQEIVEHKNAVQTSSTTHFSALGWNCRGSMPSSATDTTSTSSQEFIFSKSFSLEISAFQLAQRTLEMWTPSDPMHTHLFPAYTRSRLRLLQRIDERNFIVMQMITTNRHHQPNQEPEHEQVQQQMYQELDPNTLSVSMSSLDRKVGALLHVSMVNAEPNRCVFFLRSIPREHYELSDSDSTSTASERLEWLDVFNWCVRVLQYLLDGIIDLGQ